MIFCGEKRLEDISQTDRTTPDLMAVSNLF